MRLAAALSLLLAALCLALLWEPVPKIGDTSLKRIEASRPDAELKIDRAASATITIDAAVTQSPEAWIHVRVLDTRGTALPGIEVLRSSSISHMRVEGTKQRTDERGECRFGIDSTQREEAAAGRRFSVAVEVPIGHLIERDFDPRVPPTEVLELRVEDGGRFEIIATDERGEPHEGAVKFGIRDLDTQPTGAPPSWFENSSFTAERGRVMTPAIAIRRRWRITVEPEGHTHAQSFVIAEGPIAIGETKTVRVPLGRCRGVLTARFVDEQGQALSEAEIGAVLLCDKQVIGVDCYSTDARLPVRWPLDLRALGAQELELRVWSPRASPTHSRTFAIPTPITSTTIELGEVTCTEIPISVSGQVVDAHDAPLSGVDIGWYWEQQQAGAFCPPIATRTDAKGRFVLRVPEHSSARFLQSTLSGFTTSQVSPLVAGTVEALSLRIVLHQSRSVAGRVYLDEHARAQHWNLSLCDTLTGESRRSVWLNFDAPDDPFLLEPVPAGTYTLRFAYNAVAISDVRESSPKVSYLHEIQGVVVPEGGGSSDPRLDSINLRGKLVQREVRVLGVDGQPIAQHGGDFALRTSDGLLRSLRGHSSDDEGWWRIHAPLELTSLQLGVAGHRMATLNPNALVQEVRLERGLHVRIELGQGAPELPAGFEYTLRLSRANPTPEWNANFGSYDRRGFWARPVSANYECDVPSPGRYLLNWGLHRGEGSNQPSVPWEAKRGETIEVGELSEMQIFACSPPAEGLGATLLHFDHE